MKSYPNQEGHKLKVESPWEWFSGAITHGVALALVYEITIVMGGLLMC